MSLTTIFPKGAEWRKWDLHIHTPDSLVHHYESSVEKSEWETFINDLESLPEQFKVIGINDYLFIDGYRKILDFKKAGRLKNINTFLPVVEFRIKKFAGHKDFKRINFHVIFSDEVSPDTIQNQFLNGLGGKYKLSPGIAGVQWNGIITKESLSDLGRKIKATISPEKLPQYGTDLEEGFNNLNLDEEEILSLLKENTYLKGRYLTAIGKTEWESLSWNDQSIAEKKDIINKVDFVFISSETVDACHNAKNKLEEQLVNHLLLDCSDAHYNMSKIAQKDRIGKCFTWIKGDPTFEGLKQIKYEQETRILIQDDPPEQKTPYNVIDEVKFVGSDSSEYFQKKAIELNPNLNVIIGGKSSGKSLLLFHIAKTIDPSQVNEKLSVVSEKEYDLSTKIDNFDFSVKWKDGIVNLLSQNPEDRKRQITYVPQMYINHLAEQKGEKKLTELIESILNQNTEFKEYCDIQYDKIQNINLAIGNGIIEVFALRENYQDAYKEYRAIGDRKAIEENITKIKRQIFELNQQAGFTAEEMKKYEKLQRKRERISSARDRVDQYKSKASEHILQLSTLKQEVSERMGSGVIGWFESDRIAEIFIDKNLDSDKTHSNEMFDSLIEKYKKLATSLVKASATKSASIEIINSDLKPYTAKVSNQALLKRLESELLGDENKIRSLDEKEKQLAQIKDTGSRIKAEILANNSKLFDTYSAILSQIKKPQLSQIGTGLNLKTTLEIDSVSFQNGFCGLLDGRSNFRTLFGNSFDENNNYTYTVETHIQNLTSIFNKVWNSDKNEIKFRSGYDSKAAIQQLLKDYYKFRYDIIYNNDDILQMSPGKRGLVLLQIILHLSNAKHPILIDQPEDNLDNRTIFKDLNDFIKEKKVQRQIILVTHNANLVVSTDAEEVIVANQNGQDSGKTNAKYQFEYVTGSLENTFNAPEKAGILNKMGIREHVCDILEGGEEAFVYRERKYGFKV